MKAGQILTLKTPIRGMRSYLSVAGGIDVPLVLDSRSTDLKAGFGGFNGRALKDGDVLKAGKAVHPPQKSIGVKQLLFGNRIRAIEGLSSTNSARMPASLSGARRGSSARRATAWVIACTVTS